MAPQSTFIPHHLATFQLYTLLHRDLIPYRYLLVPGGTGTGKSYFVNGFVKGVALCKARCGPDRNARGLPSGRGSDRKASYRGAARGFTANRG